jgi:plastocyanin
VIWFRFGLFALVVGVLLVALTQTAAKPVPAAVATIEPTAEPTARPTRVPLPTLAPEAIISRISRSTPAPEARPTASTATSTAAHVEVVDYGFSPGQLVVPLGTTVTFVNDGSDGHDVTGSGPGGDWRSGPLAPSERYTRQFGLVGTYAYVCTIHPEMRGSIVVKP